MAEILGFCFIQRERCKRKAIEAPYILSSEKSFHWTLKAHPSFDYFSLLDEGAGALLLIGMHLTDPMPWLCARNPLYFRQDPGLIDLESKRILGKRFKTCPDRLPEQWEMLDPIARVLDLLEEAGHSFNTEAETPELVKTPGKLLPRKLMAHAHVRFHDQDLDLHSRNFSELSQCLHAELTLIFGLARLLSEMNNPPDQLQSFELKTTLKPCKMCAAFLHILRRKCSSFRVTYFEDDPGRLAAHTLLDQYGYQSTL